MCVCTCVCMPLLFEDYWMFAKYKYSKNTFSAHIYANAFVYARFKLLLFFLIFCVWERFEERCI